MAKPKQITRVSWSESAPHVTERHRNFERPEDAAAQVAAIQTWPDRAQLTGVWTTQCDWVETDPFTLPLTDEAAAKYDRLREGLDAI